MHYKYKYRNIKSRVVKINIIMFGEDKTYSFKKIEIFNCILSMTGNLFHYIAYCEIGKRSIVQTSGYGFEKEGYYAVD